MSSEVECPECGGQFAPSGLHGHLRFSHGLQDGKLQRVYDRAMSSGTNQLDEAAGEGEIKAGKEQLGEQGEGEEQQDREIRSLPWKSSTPERGPAAQENREPRRSGIQQAYESLDQLRRARVRLKVLKKETGEEVKRRKGVMPFSGTETVVERTDAERKLMERCQKEVERAREEFQSTLADAGGSSA